MITKEQAIALRHGATLYQTHHHPLAMQYVSSLGFNAMCPSDTPTPLAKPIKWRVNGKIKTWKREPERFQLPIKHGLYSYAYLTNENAHLFQLID